jgi:hypothetical protein
VGLRCVESISYAPQAERSRRLRGHHERRHPVRADVFCRTRASNTPHSKRAPSWDIFRDGCPSGETPGQVTARVDKVIMRIKQVHADYWAKAQEASSPDRGGDVLIVSHGHFSKCAFTFDRAGRHGHERSQAFSRGGVSSAWTQRGFSSSTPAVRRRPSHRLSAVLMQRRRFRWRLSTPKSERAERAVRRAAFFKK